MVARHFRLACLAALAAALAGCGAKKAPKADDQRTASGQILPGSASDAMIAYDALTSQPPIAAPKHEAIISSGDAADSSEASPDPQPEAASTAN
jgi:hypothetical protein